MNDEHYALRLQSISQRPLKRLLKPINPYRKNLRKLVRGNCLEIGCGIGRNLSYLDNRDNVGIDLNSYALAVAESMGHKVLLNSEFELDERYLYSFDNLLFSHVLEHMGLAEAEALIQKFIPCLKHDGKIVIICPQKRGFDSDKSHIEYMDFEKIGGIIMRCGLNICKTYSHPLPEIFSRLFIYNEFVVIAARKNERV
jgi:SAM-dependent methyltransferase